MYKGTKGIYMHWLIFKNINEKKTPNHCFTDCNLLIAIFQSSILLLLTVFLM